jgi:copper homeostasis protein CutC
VSAETIEFKHRLEVLFWTNFDQKSDQLQKIISQKQKKTGISKILTIDSEHEQSISLQNLNI